MKKEFNDKIIKENLIILSELELENIDNNVEEHKFSDEFNKNMDDILSKINYDEIENKDTKNKKVLKFITKKKIAVILAMCIVFTSALTIEASRKFLFNIFYNVFDDRTEVYVDKDKNTNTNTKDTYVFTFEEPSYIPEGFELVDKTVLDENASVEYKNNNKKYFIYDKYLVKGSSVFGFDTEDADIEKFTLNNTDITCVHKNDIYTYYWFDDYNASVFTTNIERKKIRLKIINTINLK